MKIFRTVSDDEFRYWRLLGWFGLIAFNIYLLIELYSVLQDFFLRDKDYFPDQIPNTIFYERFILTFIFMLFNSVVFTLILKNNKYAFALIVVILFGFAIDAILRDIKFFLYFDDLFGSIFQFIFDFLIYFGVAIVHFITSKTAGVIQK